MWAEHRDAVRPEWLDGNGHMNLAYYVVVFDRGADAWLDMAGLGAAYRAQGGTVFAVETHTIYRREVGLGTALLVRSRLVAAAGKRIHLLHEMHAGPEEVALQEVLYLHIDLATWRPGARRRSRRQWPRGCRRWRRRPARRCRRGSAARSARGRSTLGKVSAPH